MEGHGSIQVVRHVTEIGDLVDVAVTADGASSPADVRNEEPETGALRRVVHRVRHQPAHLGTASPVAMLPRSVREWPDIWAGRVTLGMADPRLDAAGYRALMVLALAQEEYGAPTLLLDLAGSVCAPRHHRRGGGPHHHRRPELLEPAPGRAC